MTGGCEGRAETAQAASRLVGIRAPILEAPVAAEQKQFLPGWARVALRSLGSPPLTAKEQNAGTSYIDYPLHSDRGFMRYVTWLEFYKQEN